jgi:hypothetical protein
MPLCLNQTMEFTELSVSGQHKNNFKFIYEFTELTRKAPEEHGVIDESDQSPTQHAQRR